MAVSLALATTLGITSTPASAAVTHIVEFGELRGAKGVDVGGTFFDVVFSDGAYINYPITLFTTKEAADAASAALLSQVFINVYDTVPRLTRGCENAFSCNIETPYAYDPVDQEYSLSRAFNGGALTLGGHIFEDAVIHAYALSSEGTSAATTLARWTPSALISAVPEPETYAMFLAGLGLLGAVSRRSKQKAAV